jgi:hypothetical protein
VLHDGVGWKKKKRSYTVCSSGYAATGVGWVGGDAVAGKCTMMMTVHVMLRGLGWHHWWHHPGDCLRGSVPYWQVSVVKFCILHVIANIMQHMQHLHGHNAACMKHHHHHVTH